MIVGVGIDVVDVARFLATLDRAPRLVEKIFTPEERDVPPSSLAARFAAKEVKLMEICDHSREVVADCEDAAT